MATHTRKRASVIGTSLVVIGAFAWLIAWFVPAASLEGSSHPDSLLKGGPDARPLSGFYAFACAASLLPKSLEQGDLATAVLGATCATNLVMLAALMLHRVVPWRRALGFALFACALLNSTWLFLGDDLCRAGYYVWLASFVLTGAGIVAAKPPS